MDSILNGPEPALVPGHRMTVLRHQSVGRPRGFTMLEALLATGILLLIVIAVTNAITAGQQHAFEAQQRIGGALAAEELLGRLLTVAYDDLPSWQGYTEPIGTLTDADGQPYPATAAALGRSVDVTTVLDTLPETGVRVRGREVRVAAFDVTGRTLAELVHFVPEPAS